jgi:hypothetical protein
MERATLELCESFKVLIALTLEQANALIDYHARTMCLLNRKREEAEEEVVHAPAELEEEVELHSVAVDYDKGKEEEEVEEDDDDEEEEDDSFIVPDDKEIDDRYARPDPSTLIIAGKRSRAAVSRFKPDSNFKRARQEERAEERNAKDVVARTRASRHETHELKCVREILINKHEFRTVARRNEWFKRKFYEPLMLIRSALGHEGARMALPQRLFDAICSDEPAEVNVGRATAPMANNRQCCFCNTTKPHHSSLTVSDKTYPIARCCMQLAGALIRFCRVLRGDDDNDVDALDAAMGEVQAAHAGKASFHL